ncbi:MAG: hypothetical protein ABR501_15460, partial [Pyrinomonadaceae bacterium]
MKDHHLVSQNAPTSILVVLAKTLAKSIDTGGCLEYRARVLIANSCTLNGLTHNFPCIPRLSRYWILRNSVEHLGLDVVNS